MVSVSVKWSGKEHIFEESVGRVGVVREDE